MALDPNWFFSTLAQSMATIVGVAGGFLFAWLLSRRSEIVAERRQFLSSLMSFTGELALRRAQVLEVGRRSRAAFEELQSLRAAGGLPLRVARFPLISHPEYDVPDPTPSDIAALGELPAECELFSRATNYSREQLADLILTKRPFGGDAAEPYRHLAQASDPFAVSGVSSVNFWSGLREQRAHAAWLWGQKAREFDSLSAAVRDFQRRIVPRSIYVLLGILGGLLLSGVLVPVAFLSAGDSTAKCWLLAVSGTLTFAFLVFLAVEVRYLRSAVNLKDEHF